MVSNINVLVSDRELISQTRLPTLLQDGLCGNTGSSRFNYAKLITCPTSTRGRYVQLQRAVLNSWMDVAEVGVIVYALQ